VTRGTFLSRLTWLSGLALLLWVGSAGVAWGQVCREPDSTAELVRQTLARYALANHPGEERFREKLGLPRTAQISVVSSESVCKKANAAYQTEVVGEGYGGVSGVIQVGTTYAVFDPVCHWGPDPGYYIVVIYDSKVAEAEPLHALTCFVLLCSAERSSGSCPQGGGFDSRRSHPPLNPVRACRREVRDRV
jgi:hypothetical protein